MAAMLARQGNVNVGHTIRSVYSDNTIEKGSNITRNLNLNILTFGCTILASLYQIKLAKYETLFQVLVAEP